MQILDCNGWLKTIHFCFGGGGSTPQVTAPPAPAPVPTASEPSVAGAQENRRQQLARLRYGLASTIKTSPTGVDLTSTNNQQGAKKTLG